MVEIWKPVLGWEGYYSVSNMGRVKRDAGSPRCKTDRLLLPRMTNYNYLVFAPVRKGTTQKAMCVHRAVLESFIGPAPTELHQGNHKNGNKIDNRAENLEWVTRSENIAHAYRTGLHRRYAGSNASAAKLNEEQVAEILRKIAAREYRRDIAVEFGISTKMIDEIVQGNHWRHVPRPDMSMKRMGRHILTESDVREIRVMLKSMTCREIGERFGVTGPTIWHIKSGRTWTHIK
ncbi:MAG: HNH endonuclease [Tessaracoccus sp.]|uniref:HNH endonuclease n=1 Tax=Tessaracoccus sp. TaxID=1971211 RepID=UPI001EC5FB29|nr:HNH endonuclease [Tessaracoccus sp.]MBK7822925.1 HNH endonuclease [Tessaracoccus sp.]